MDEKQIITDNVNILAWGGIRKKAIAGFEQAQQLTQQGNPTGNFEQAKHYLVGWLVPHNIDHALALYEDAAKRNHAGACCKLANLYFLGKHVAADIQKARTYLTDEKIEAMKAIGTRFDTQDYKQAKYINELKPLKKSIDIFHQKETRASITSGLAAQGDARGQYVLAQLQRGEGKYLLACNNFKLAADQGHAGACYELTRASLLGDQFMGIDKDLNQAEIYASNAIDTTAFDTPNYKQADTKVWLEDLLETIQASKGTVHIRP